MVLGAAAFAAEDAYAQEPPIDPSANAPRSTPSADCPDGEEWICWGSASQLCECSAPRPNWRAVYAKFGEAEATRGPEQRWLYERAAVELVGAAEAAPDDPNAPLALEKAAIALQRAGRISEARGLYERIVSELEDAGNASHSHDEATRRTILLNAAFRSAYLAERLHRYADAVRGYEQVIHRYGHLATEDAGRRVGDALVRAGLLHERLGNWRRAADRYRAYARVEENDTPRRTALFRAASMELRAGNHRRANGELRRWIAREGGDAEPGLVAEAWLRVAESWGALGRTRPRARALHRVLALAVEHPDDPRVTRAAAVARARLEPASPPSLDSFAAGRHLELRDAPPALER